MPKKNITKLIQIFIFIFLLNFVNFTNAQTSRGKTLCPEILSSIPHHCDKIKCKLEVTPQMCPFGTYFRENVSMCNCCPGCVKYLEKDEECETVTPPHYDPLCFGRVCTILSSECAPGLSCDPRGGRRLCGAPLNWKNPDFSNSSQHECNFKRYSCKIGKYHWQPSCEDDGSYSPLQCKGVYTNGICFCVNRQGERIFGWSRWNEIDKNKMNCGCSRRTHELQVGGNIATFHCSPHGNYEKLQCDTDSNLCFCVDEITGKTSGAILPSAQWKHLPCYVEKDHGNSRNVHYLRRCESEMAANKVIQKKGLAHGLTVFAPGLLCDPDGSFGAIQKPGQQTRCVLKTGTDTEYAQAQNDNERPMDCQCLRDLTYEQNYEKMECAQNTGNYPKAFDYGDKAACVDSDGFPYGVVPKDQYCCLDGSCIEKCRVNGTTVPICPDNQKYIFDWEESYAPSTSCASDNQFAQQSQNIKNLNSFAM